MSKSTKLVTATYILSYVAACDPEVVTTERIAEKVDDHPTRVRQIVSSLVKRGLLHATRGGRGGVQLARPAAQITMRDIQEAVQDQSLLSFHLRDPVSEWAGKSQVHSLFLGLQAELDQRIRQYLDEHTLDQTYTPLIVPFAPGGTTDVLARTLGEALNPGRKDPVLVEYRPAGSAGPLGALGTAAQMGGRTLVIATNSSVVAAALAPGGEARLAAYVPVAQLTTTELILAVRANEPPETLDALLRTAALRRGSVKYASVGPGSMSHLAAEWLQHESGTRMKHVPFAGAQPAVNALLAGKVSFYFGTPPTILPHVQAGSLKALATTGRKRSALLADTPTVMERFPGFEVTGWQGVFAPATTPARGIRQLGGDIGAALKQPQVRSRLRRQGFTISESTPKEFAAAVTHEVALWRERIEALGIAL